VIEPIRASLNEARLGLELLIADEARLQTIAVAAERLIAVFEAQGRVFSCGNGGSMCDAMHFAEELTGRFRKDRKGYAATAISDPGHLTCVGNDFGYDAIFARYIEAHARPGDALIAISTSGKSPSILNAAVRARELGVIVIGLTGKPGSPLDALCDVVICTPAGQFADRVQELHIKVLHIIIELIERHFHPENYLSAS
jgi:D-sedoheptulose 7-phosphate isomerase